MPREAIESNLKASMWIAGLLLYSPCASATNPGK